MILTLSHSKECFCRFVAKLGSCQVFFAPRKVLVCLQLITLILAVFVTQMKVFSCFSPKLQCPHLLSHWKRFSAVRS